MSNPFGLAFIIGAPRSGTTMLERMLSSHSDVKGGPETHLLTPLAHLGYWRNVDRAPYDHIVASIGQQAFVDSLPAKEKDYWHACRSYCDVLYSAYMADSKELICLDKTPEYAVVWPFITKLFPDAKYVVLTRHPAAVFTSFAGSFFSDDFHIAHEHDPIVERYVPALAGLLRQHDVDVFHLRYEDLVQDPEHWMKLLCEYLEIPYQHAMIDYGDNHDQAAAESGLGDPIGVAQYTRPSSTNVHGWAARVATDPEKLNLLQSMIDSIDEADLETIGYAKSELWAPLDDVGKKVKTRKKFAISSYQIQRRLIMKGRSLAQRSKRVRAMLQWFRLACDVMLREY